jgi:hypothetical protein
MKRLTHTHIESGWKEHERIPNRELQITRSSLCIDARSSQFVQRHSTHAHPIKQTTLTIQKTLFTPQPGHIHFGLSTRKSGGTSNIKEETNHATHTKQ